MSRHRMRGPRKSDDVNAGGCRSIEPDLQIASVQQICAQHPFFAAREGGGVSHMEAVVIKGAVDAFAACGDKAIGQRHVPVTREMYR